MTSILQAVVTVPQILSGPTIGTIISAFAGVTALFILKEIVGMRDKVRSIWTAIYGEEGTNVESGLLYEAASSKEAVASLNTAFADHVNKEQTWQRDITANFGKSADRHHATLMEIDSRLDKVEVQVGLNVKALESLSHGRRKA